MGTATIDSSKTSIPDIANAWISAVNAGNTDIIIETAMPADFGTANVSGLSAALGTTTSLSFGSGSSVDDTNTI